MEQDVREDEGAPMEKDVPEEIEQPSSTEQTRMPPPAASDQNHGAAPPFIWRFAGDEHPAGVGPPIPFPYLPFLLGAMAPVDSSRMRGDLRRPGGSDGVDQKSSKPKPRPDDF
nr:unnamed protein product [Digitaria exilis]